MSGGLGAESFRGLAHGEHMHVLQHMLTVDPLPIDRGVSRHAVASVLVVTDADEVLLARNRTGGWGTVGGHVEPSDGSLQEAAARELREEAGIEADPDRLKPLLFLADLDEFRPGHAHADFCFVLRVPSRLVAVADDDVSEIDWFSLDGLPPLNEHMSRAVAALRA